MKTIFLFLRQGISNRNLLRTDFLKTLQEQSEVRIVILSPIGNETDFRQEFESGNVRVEVWPRTKVGFWEKRLKNLKDYIWVSRGLTQAIRVRRLSQLGSWGLAWRDIVGRLARAIGVSEERINQWEIDIYKSNLLVKTLYEKYQPDLVIFTRLFGTNLHVIKEAKKREIPVLCLVESWDNLISKGPLSVIPDRMAVWNEGMKIEADEFHGFPSQRVDVVGVPQFDLYSDVEQFIGKKEFFETHGLDPHRKLVTYATSTEGFIQGEPEIVEMLYKAVQEDRFGEPVQLLLRMHPISSPELQAEYFNRFSGLPNLVLQRPGRAARLHDGWDPTWSDMLVLASTIYHSDIVLDVASTFTIDAAALDKPVVCIAFGAGTKKTPSKYFRDIFGRSHYRKLVDTGGIRVVYDMEGLVGALRHYLGDPTLDALGRRQLRETLCSRLDGKSAWRAAWVVLRELGFGHSTPIQKTDVDKDEKQVILPNP